MGVDRLMLRAFDRGTFAELLIDCEEDRTLRAVLVGMLREGREAIAGRWRTVGFTLATYVHLDEDAAATAAAEAERLLGG